MALLSFNTMDDFDYSGQTVIVRVDINSPLDPVTKKIVNENRLDKSVPTLRELLERGAKVAILAHQGDTLDYHNLIPLAEHGAKLGAKLGRNISYIDDVAGPTAVAAVQALQPGEAVLLGNVRYLAEEVSTFEQAVKLSATAMAHCYLIRQLAPWADYFVNDAFAAAHRNAPSMVGFTPLLPSAAGRQLVAEVRALQGLTEHPVRPSVFVLGGLKVSDAFAMMETVLAQGSADLILTGGVTGIIMGMARGFSFGPRQERFIEERGLSAYRQSAEHLWRDYAEHLLHPLDYGWEENGERRECGTAELPGDDALLLDIGPRTVASYRKVITGAGTVFVNGPMGMYENPLFAYGTKEVWNAVATGAGYSVIGGGDSVNAAMVLVAAAEGRFDYISTAGGALVRFLSGQELPLLRALHDAYRKV